MSIPVTVKIFAGIVKRLFAFGIDLIILNLSFLLIYFLTRNTGLISIDYWLLFMIIFVFYFAIGDSTLTKGNTVGKKMLNINVVNFEGKFIDFTQSVTRGFYVALTYFIIDISKLIYNTLSETVYSLAIVIMLTIFITFLVCSITIFTTFHPYHQGFHDVICKSIVVVKDRFKPEILDKSFNTSRLTASYFLTVVIVFIVLIVVIPAKLLFFSH